MFFKSEKGSQIRKCFSIPKKYFKSKNAFQIQICFSNPKMFFKSDWKFFKLRNVKMILPLTFDLRKPMVGTYWPQEQHGWILFELKVIYFCRVVVFSSVGFRKDDMEIFFWHEWDVLLQVLGEWNDGKIFCSQCGRQKRCEESTLRTFQTERERATYYFRRGFRYETIISFLNEYHGISEFWRLRKEDCAIMDCQREIAIHLRRHFAK